MRASYLVNCHESPKQYTYLLTKRDYIHWIRQISLLRVYDVSEEFSETCIEGVQVYTSMDNSHQSEMLIDSEVLH